MRSSYTRNRPMGPAKKATPPIGGVALWHSDRLWPYRMPFSISGAMSLMLFGVTVPTPVSMCRPGIR